MSHGTDEPKNRIASNAIGVISWVVALAALTFFLLMSFVGFKDFGDNHPFLFSFSMVGVLATGFFLTKGLLTVLRDVFVGVEQKALRKEIDVMSLEIERLRRELSSIKPITEGNYRGERSMSPAQEQAFIRSMEKKS